MAAGRNSQEERGGGAGGGGRGSVGVVLIRYCGRDLFGGLSVCFVLLCQIRILHEQTVGALVVPTGDKEKKKKKDGPSFQPHCGVPACRRSRAASAAPPALPRHGGEEQERPPSSPDIAIRTGG